MAVTTKQLDPADYLAMDEACVGYIAARARLLARLRAQPAVDIGRWTRDELYADAT